MIYTHHLNWFLPDYIYRANDQIAGLAHTRFIHLGPSRRFYEPEANTSAPNSRASQFSVTWPKGPGFLYWNKNHVKQNQGDFLRQTDSPL